MLLDSVNDLIETRAAQYQMEIRDLASRARAAVNRSCGQTTRRERERCERMVVDFWAQRAFDSAGVDVMTTVEVNRGAK